MLGVCGSHPDHGLNNEICQASHLHILDNTCVVIPYRLRSFLATIERRGLSVAAFGRPRLRKIEQPAGTGRFFDPKIILTRIFHKLARALTCLLINKKDFAQSSV
ncbi:hypothetical protein SAMN05421754_104124 [Nitrosomonas sp. Nm58]|nr:hypothetical protein SAMN05421754_104124 [Nitrosomonas sp. Nm58]